MRLLAFAAASALIAVGGCRPRTPSVALLPPESGESHLANIRQLTFGGQNAEAYFSKDGRRIIWQATMPGGSGCDQEYVMNADGSHVHRVSQRVHFGERSGVRSF